MDLCLVLTVIIIVIIMCMFITNIILDEFYKIMLFSCVFLIIAYIIIFAYLI